MDTQQSLRYQERIYKNPNGNLNFAYIFINLFYTYLGRIKYNSASQKI